MSLLQKLLHQLSPTKSITTWSPSLAFEPFLRSLKSFADEAKLSKASSTAALSDLLQVFEA